MGYFLDLLQQQKGLSTDTLKLFKVAVVEDNCLYSFNCPEEIEDYILNKEQIVIPFYSVYGDLLGCSFRINGKPKYLTPIENKKNYLFGLNVSAQSIVDSNSAIIVEGCFDMMAMYQAGFKNVVALMGTNLSNKQLYTLRRLCQKVYILLDGDRAGENASAAILNDLIKIGMSATIVKVSQDPDDFLAGHRDEALEFFKQHIV